MLSRTADSLFWLARYIERAENMARLIDMGRRMTTIPVVAAGAPTSGRRNEWPSVLAASGGSEAFQEWSGTPAFEAAQADAIPFLMLARENPSSVISCFEFARGNARAARAGLTQDMWEAVNDVWIEFRPMRPDRLKNGAMSPMLDRIKSASAQFRGACDSSALRNDGYTFLRLGLAIERADNIARLLDVKSYMAAGAAPGGGADHYAIAAILRAAGVERAYRCTYPAEYAPEHLSHFLVHNPTCPRSVRASALETQRRLGDLATLYGARKPSHDLADGLLALLDHAEAVALEPEAAHEMLSAVIRRNNALSMQIAEDYYFAPKRAPEPEAATQKADRRRPAAAPQTRRAPAAPQAEAEAAAV